jgi:3-oxoadipate enol-lactonase
MKVIDRGTGTPVVLIPGIQGRWEWMSPTVDALASRCRVITFSLADEPTCGGRFDEAAGFSCYVEQVTDALDRCGLEQAVICGVSYGGLIAATYAARHPERVAALVLVSALPPSWRPDARASFYLKAPRLLSPLFFLASLRMYREIAAARPGLAASLRESARHGINVLRHMLSPERMARRVRLISARAGAPADAGVDDFARFQRPTLIVTGDEDLDRVVPVRLTREYTMIWPHARQARLARTGHIGLITKPAEFAAIVADFASEQGGENGAASRIQRRRWGN